jgi:hypothetical protein
MNTGTLISHGKKFTERQSRPSTLINRSAPLDFSFNVLDIT